MKRLYLPSFAIILGCMFMQVCKGQTYENMTQLRLDLLLNYHSDVRPLLDQSQILHMNLTLNFYGLVEVDSVKGILTLVLSTYCAWYDEKLVWKPADYGGITKILLKINEIWTPTIALGTPIEFTSMGKSWMHVVVQSNGFASFNPGDVIESSCSFNVKFWPFDKQVCDVSFFPMDYTLDQVQIAIPDNGFQNNFVAVKNSEWTLEDNSYRIRTMYGVTETLFTLKLQRQSMFYVLSLILPLTGMFIISSLVFLMPEQSGERVSYCITIMLALAVFLTVVADEMPKSSDPISLMCVFILLGMINSIVTMVIVILNMRWYYKSDKEELHPWHIFLVRITQCKRKNKVKDGREEIQHSDNRISKEYMRKATRGLTKTNLSETKGNAGGLIFIQPKDTSEINYDVTWQDVSGSVDILAFCFFFIFATISSVSFLVYLVVATGYES